MADGGGRYRSVLKAGDVTVARCVAARGEHAVGPTRGTRGSGSDPSSVERGARTTSLPDSIRK